MGPCKAHGPTVKTKCTRKGFNFVLLPERLARCALHLRHPIQWVSPKFCRLTVLTLWAPESVTPSAACLQFPASVIQKYLIVYILATNSPLGKHYPFEKYIFVGVNKDTSQTKRKADKCHKRTFVFTARTSPVSFTNF